MTSFIVVNAYSESPQLESVYMMVQFYLPCLALEHCVPARLGTDRWVMPWDNIDYQVVTYCFPMVFERLPTPLVGVEQTMVVSREAPNFS